jgi:hypothetical protein
MSSHQRQLRSVLRIAAIALVGVFAAVQTSSAFLESSVAYSFTGTCTDCTNETATLTLQNYTLGQPINKDNFVSFAYNSSVIANKTITPAGNPTLGIQGGLPATLPGPSHPSFGIRESNSNNAWEFEALSDGTWCAGADCRSDTGTNGVWNLAAPAAPVTGTLALTSFGLILLILMGWILLRRSPGAQLS